MGDPDLLKSGAVAGLVSVLSLLKNVLANRMSTNKKNLNGYTNKEMLGLILQRLTLLKKI